MWWIFALLSALFAALTAIFAKIGIKNVNTDLATAIRTVIIALLTWGIVLFSGHTATLAALTKKNWIFLILSGITTGLSWLFYFRALQVGKVAQVAAVDKLSVALAILLAALFLHESLTWKTSVAALLIIAGTIILVLE